MILDPPAFPALLRPALAGLFTLAAAGAHAGAAPLYHLQVLEVPDATSVSVKDINDAGQIVGTYTDQDFIRHAVLWDAQGWHDLALPSGTDSDGIAFAINNAGQIVGTANDYVNATAGLLWNATTPGQYTVLNGAPDVSVNPADISDTGVVVGGFGVPSRAFVWTAQGGLVDYGIQDPGVPDQQARWSAVNGSGRLVGRWNQHVSNIHATIGQIGTVAVLGMGGASDEFPTNAVALNAAGTTVGLGLAVDDAQLVPVVFGADGGFSAIPGATLGQPNGCATAINDAGVIVGVAGIGTANGPVPGLQAWVHRDGATYDLYAVVDDPAIFTSFSSAAAINADGVIVGTGRTADDSIASFVLTPLRRPDAVFADGFEAPPHR
jgi:uncharacterized membrane protein